MKGILNNNHDREGLIEFLNKLDLSRPFTWVVKRKVKRRTVSQNSLYWLYLSVIAEDTGNSPDALHEAFKQMFLSPVVVDIGERGILTYSTRGLNTVQFTQYLEQITAEAAGMGIVLPNPDDLIFDSFVDHYGDRL